MLIFSLISVLDLIVPSPAEVLIAKAAMRIVRSPLTALMLQHGTSQIQVGLGLKLTDAAQFIFSFSISHAKIYRFTGTISLLGLSGGLSAGSAWSAAA